MLWNGEAWIDGLKQAANAGLGAAAMVCADTAVRNLSKNSPPSAPGDFPGHDLSLLRNSIAWATPDVLYTPLHAAFGTAVKYGRIHEFGGVITAKGKALKVPIDRKLARQVERAGTKLTLIKRKGKPPLLVLIKNEGRSARRGSGGNFAGGHQMTPVYVLKKSVRIPARPWIRRSSTMAQPRAQKAFELGTKNWLVAHGLLDKES